MQTQLNVHFNFLVKGLQFHSPFLHLSPSCHAFVWEWGITCEWSQEITKVIFKNKNHTYQISIFLLGLLYWNNLEIWSFRSLKNTFLLQCHCIFHAGVEVVYLLVFIEIPLQPSCKPSHSITALKSSSSSLNFDQMLQRNLLSNNKISIFSVETWVNVIRSIYFN